MILNERARNMKGVNCGCDANLRKILFFKQSSLAPFIHQWLQKSTPLLALTHAYYIEQMRRDGLFCIDTLDNFNELAHKEIVEAIKDRYDEAPEYVNTYRSLLKFLKTETMGWFRGTGV